MLTVHSLCSQCINGTGKHHNCNLRGVRSLRWHTCKFFVKAELIEAKQY
jgi:hypothetical protein